MKTVLTLALITLLAGCSKAPSADAPTIAADAAGPEQACQRDFKRFIQFNDPDSARVNSVEATQNPENFIVSVSAKNAMGGYPAPVLCICATEKAAVVSMTCDVAT